MREKPNRSVPAFLSFSISLSGYHRIELLEETNYLLAQVYLSGENDASKRKFSKGFSKNRDARSSLVFQFTEIMNSEARFLIRSPGIVINLNVRETKSFYSGKRLELLPFSNPLFYVSKFDP